MRGLGFIFLLTLCLTGLFITQAVDLDEWGSDIQDIPETPITIETPKTAAKDSPGKSTKDIPSPPVQAWKPRSKEQLKIEAALMILITTYVVNIFVGRRRNNSIAETWAKTFCLPDGVFDKNFTLVGAGVKAPLIKESASQYRLYCSGRRFCRSLHATLKLKSRQDLFSIVWGLIFPSEDRVEIEVYMKEGTMPLTVLAVATKKAMRTILQEEGGEDDVRQLTRRLDVKVPGWPSEKLQVYGEHSSIFQDLMNEQILDGIFRRPAFDTQSKYFRMLHITPEQTYGPKDQKEVIRFTFALPEKDNMEDLTKLMSSVGVFIDAVGNLKLSPELQKKAEKTRQDEDKKPGTEKDKELRDLAEERQSKKRFEEAEKMRRMTPDQREKYKEKRDKLETQRRQRKMMKRM